MKKESLTSLNLTVTFVREGKHFVAYSPALDLSTQGKTIDDAKRKFEEAVEILFDDLTESGTLETFLLDMGWKKGRRGKSLTPPEEYSSHVSVKIPSFA